MQCWGDGRVALRQIFCIQPPLVPACRPGNTLCWKLEVCERRAEHPGVQLSPGWGAGWVAELRVYLVLVKPFVKKHHSPPLKRSKKMLIGLINAGK